MYNPEEAPNRRIKRLIEAENKKERNKEKSAFNDLVRSLVEDLKTRDPRYKKFMMQKTKEKEEKKRKLEEEKEAKRQEHQRKLKEHREELARQYAKMEEESGSDVEYVDEDLYKCDICNKVFKTLGAFNSHLESKKHK